MTDKDKEPKVEQTNDFTDFVKWPLRKLAHTIVHIIYPYGNVDVFFGPGAGEDDDFPSLADGESFEKLAEKSIVKVEYDKETVTLKFSNVKDEVIFEIPLERLGTKLEIIDDHLVLKDTKGYELSKVKLQVAGGGTGGPGSSGAVIVPPEDLKYSYTVGSLTEADRVLDSPYFSPNYISFAHSQGRCLEFKTNVPNLKDFIFKDTDDSVIGLQVTGASCMEKIGNLWYRVKGYTIQKCTLIVNNESGQPIKSITSANGVLTFKTSDIFSNTNQKVNLEFGVLIEGNDGGSVYDVWHSASRGTPSIEFSNLSPLVKYEDDMLIFSKEPLKGTSFEYEIKVDDKLIKHMSGRVTKMNDSFNNGFTFNNDNTTKKTKITITTNNIFEDPLIVYIPGFTQIGIPIKRET